MSRHFLPLSTSPDWAAGIVAKKHMMLDGMGRRWSGGQNGRYSGEEVFVDGGGGIIASLGTGNLYALDGTQIVKDWADPTKNTPQYFQMVLDVANKCIAGNLSPISLDKKSVGYTRALSAILRFVASGTPYFCLLLSGEYVAVSIDTTTIAVLKVVDFISTVLLKNQVLKEQILVDGKTQQLYTPYEVAEDVLSMAFDISTQSFSDFTYPAGYDNYPPPAKGTQGFADLSSDAKYEPDYYSLPDTVTELKTISNSMTFDDSFFRKATADFYAAINTGPMPKADAYAQIAKLISTFNNAVAAGEGVLAAQYSAFSEGSNVSTGDLVIVSPISDLGPSPIIWIDPKDGGGGLLTGLYAAQIFTIPIILSYQAASGYPVPGPTAYHMVSPAIYSRKYTKSGKDGWQYTNRKLSLADDVLTATDRTLIIDSASTVINVRDVPKDTLENNFAYINSSTFPENAKTFNVLTGQYHEYTKSGTTFTPVGDYGTPSQVVQKIINAENKDYGGYIVVTA